MPYVYFTEEQKEWVKLVDMVDFLQLQGENCVYSGK